MLEENILNISDPGQGPKSSATTQEKKKSILALLRTAQ